jgi:hypothetical protein
MTADVAVVIPTVLRPSLLVAIDSIYAQQSVGRIQILIGVDIAKGEIAALEEKLAARPGNVSVVVLMLPYSTTKRNGGLHSARDGGATRTILSFMANAPYVAYLDDDNRWSANHLAVLLKAIEGQAWAASQRFLVDEVTGETVCVDRWDSVGAGKGRFASIGGLVDTSCLMVDKLAVLPALSRWSRAATGSDGGSDRSFFSGISKAPHRFVEEPTVYYSMRPTNILWKFIRENAEFPPVVQV